jgi:glutamate racemase
MKIGVFDSGLGGLIVLKGIRELLPSYELLYLGDTKRLPYGQLTQEKIFSYTVEAMDYLFGQDCQLIVIACNTISTRALRRIQREYLPDRYPERRVLGVVVPSVEAVCFSFIFICFYSYFDILCFLVSHSTLYY